MEQRSFFCIFQRITTRKVENNVLHGGFLRVESKSTRKISAERRKFILKNMWMIISNWKCEKYFNKSRFRFQHLKVNPMPKLFRRLFLQDRKRRKRYLRIKPNSLEDKNKKFNEELNFMECRQINISVIILPKVSVFGRRAKEFLKLTKALFRKTPFFLI